MQKSYKANPKSPEFDRKHVKVGFNSGSERT